MFFIFLSADGPFSSGGCRLTFRTTLLSVAMRGKSASLPTPSGWFTLICYARLVKLHDLPVEPCPSGSHQVLLSLQRQMEQRQSGPDWARLAADCTEIGVDSAKFDAEVGSLIGTLRADEGTQRSAISNQQSAFSTQQSAKSEARKTSNQHSALSIQPNREQLLMLTKGLSSIKTNVVFA